MDKPERPDRLDRVLLDAAIAESNRQFIAAWQGWRGPGCLLPKRSAVELGGIKHLLGGIMLFEFLSKDRILIKSAGSQLREHSGFEATGRSLRDITPPEQWPVRRWRMNAVATRPCGAWTINIDTGTRSGDSVFFESVTLPTEPDEPEQPRLLMSSVAFLGGIYEPRAKDRPQFAWLPQGFCFLDLGAGIPDLIHP
jgi:hypothetical protein